MCLSCRCVLFLFGFQVLASTWNDALMQQDHVVVGKAGFLGPGWENASMYPAPAKKYRKPINWKALYQKERQKRRTGR